MLALFKQFRPVLATQNDYTDEYVCYTASSLTSPQFLRRANGLGHYRRVSFGRSDRSILRTLTHHHLVGLVHLHLTVHLNRPHYQLPLISLVSPPFLRTSSSRDPSGAALTRPVRVDAPLFVMLDDPSRMIIPYGRGGSDMTSEAGDETRTSLKDWNEPSGRVGSVADCSPTV